MRYEIRIINVKPQDYTDCADYTKREDMLEDMREYMGVEKFTR